MARRPSQNLTEREPKIMQVLQSLGIKSSRIAGQ
jgi:hypothetical protein